MRNTLELRIMGYMTTHKNWFERLAQGDSGRQAALKSSISISTLNRQLAKGEIDPVNVIALARGYNRSVLEALVATGYITEEEAAIKPAENAVEMLPDRLLIREVARRIDSDPAAWFGTFGELEEEPQEQQPASVHDIHDRDALIERINAGTEPVAAQEATEPLEQDWT